MHTTKNSYLSVHGVFHQFFIFLKHNKYQLQNLTKPSTDRECNIIQHSHTNERISWLKFWGWLITTKWVIWFGSIVSELIEKAAQLREKIPPKKSTVIIGYLVLSMGERWWKKPLSSGGTIPWIKTQSKEWGYCGVKVRAKSGRSGAKVMAAVF